MGGYLNPSLNGGLPEISALGLAHVGDAVFDLMTRTWLCATGALTARLIHGGAVSIVSAAAQSAAARRLMPELSGEELAVYRRGRNARVNSVPHGSTHGEYHAATGLEALFGYLYLSGRTERLEELFSMIVGD